MTIETMILEDGSEIACIHYLTRPASNAVTPYIACMPGLKEFSASKTRQQPWMRTQEIEAVTCPVCKSTKDYSTAKQSAEHAIRFGKVKV